MRTTLTLDEDVVILIARVQKGRNTSLKEVVNSALRGGLLAMTAPTEARRIFTTSTFKTGKRLVPDLDNIAEALAAAEARATGDTG